MVVQHDSLELLHFLHLVKLPSMHHRIGQHIVGHTDNGNGPTVGLAVKRCVHSDVHLRFRPPASVFVDKLQVSGGHSKTERRLNVPSYDAWDIKVEYAHVPCRQTFDKVQEQLNCPEPNHVQLQQASETVWQAARCPSRQRLHASYLLLYQTLHDAHLVD
jgi:hypothetical protein